MAQGANRKRQSSWLLLALAALLVLVLVEAGRTLVTAGLQIKIEGNLAPQERDQLNMLIEPHMDAGALMLDPEVLAKDISSLPWVGAVELYRHRINKVSVKVSHSLVEPTSEIERTLQNLIGDLARASDAPRTMHRDQLRGEGGEAADSELRGLFLAFDHMARDIGLEIESLRLSPFGGVGLNFLGDKQLMLGDRECVRRFDRFARVYRARVGEGRQHRCAL